MAYVRGVMARSRKKTPRLRRFFAYFGAEAELDGTKAARLAGYSWPEKTEARLRKAWPEEFEKAEVAFKERLVVSWSEAQELLAAVARNPKHKDQLKAVELVAKLHGKLDPKLSIALDRKTIDEHLQELLQQMAQNKLATGDALPQLPQMATGQKTHED